MVIVQGLQNTLRFCATLTLAIIQEEKLWGLFSCGNFENRKNEIKRYSISPSGISVTRRTGDKTTS